MIKIADFIPVGRKNAVSARELAAMFNTSPRAITHKIEHERAEGVPICASPDGKTGGYYLPESLEDLNAYCNQLNHRIKSIEKTRRAVQRTGRKLAGVSHG